MVFKPTPGLWNTNSYLSSGIPFLTGSIIPSSSFATNNSEVVIYFPYVTKSITVINRKNVDIRIHFNSLSDGNVEGGRHYLTLSEDKSSMTFSYKTKQVFISLVSGTEDGEFELMAELTNIPTKEMVQLTGSGLTD